MLKSRVLKLATAAVATTSALGLSGLGTTTAFAATTAHPATTAAAVKPATVSGCTYGTSSGNIRTCFGIIGSYTYVNSMWMTATMGSVGRELHFEITGPSFTVNSESIYVAPHTWYGFADPVNRDVKPGAYHGITWRLLDGQWSIAGEVTWNVIA